MRRWITIASAALLMFLSLGTATLRAEDYPKLLGPIEPKAGDTVMFLGDSITHQCLYTQYVEDYFITRYPQMRLHFYNSGVSGDLAGDALRRFDGDVAAIKPTYVTILLGMNDGRYEDFDQKIFDTYRTDMTTLIDKLQKLGATVILMKPTPYDVRAWQIRPKGQWKWPNDATRAGAYNRTMAYFGAWVQQTAEDRGLGYVDLYSPLNDALMLKRRENPTFTIMPEGIHPDPFGHAIMAYTMLETMHPDRTVSALRATLGHDGKWHVKGNGEVTDVDGDVSHLKFTYTCKCLPWVLPAEAKDGFDFVHAGHHMSNERLVVQGLKAGRYKLTIDGVDVGTYWNGVLASKVELENNAKTPEYQQALAVAMINKERNEKAVHPLRDQWGHLKGMRGKGEPDAAWMEKFKAETDKYKKLADEYEDKAYAAAQPKARVYELTLVTGGK